MKADNPAISIIIGTKGRDLLLPRAINSVLSQNFSDWECIVIDCDTSKKTHQCVEKFCDQRIHYFGLNPDPGRAASLNYGIMKSKGRFLCFLDDDDEYFPTKLSKQFALINETTEEVGLVYCWTTFYDEKAGRTISECKRTIEGDVFKHTLSRMSLCSFPALMFKKNVLLEFNGIIDRVGYPSDWQLVCRICQKYHVKCLPEILLKVNKNHLYEQMSRPVKKDYEYKDRIIKWHIDFLSEFSEGYSRYPEASIVHLNPLIAQLMVIKRYKEAWGYYIKLIIAQPKSLKPHLTLCKSFINSFWH